MLGFISESSTINCERRGQIVGIFNLPLWLCTVVGQIIYEALTGTSGSSMMDVKAVQKAAFLDSQDKTAFYFITEC